MDEAQADALLRLALVPGLGPVTATRLLAQVEDPRELFAWPLSRLCAVDGMGSERARRLLDPQGLEQVTAERARCARAGISVLVRGAAGYPRHLMDLHDPPLVLWLRGELLRRDELAVAVVGPRRPSAYGHRQARRLAMGLARAGATVISGLARGIDTVAHQAALDGDGRTLAVLGSGFTHLYPEENRDLAATIADGRGALLSEYPLDTRPSPGTFPRRNRLVAALSLGVLVIEAGARSGALITARLGGELGREVMVLPGPIDRPEHVGSNRLLRDGATLITSLDELFEEIPPLATLARGHQDDATAHQEHPRISSLSERERSLFRLLGDQARSVDDIVATTGLPASQVQATLLSLELRRLARKAPGGFVVAS